MENEYVILHDGNVIARGSWVFCMQIAYKILRDLDKSLDDYVCYERKGDEYTAFAYYDNGGRIIQIVIKKSEF